MSESDGTPTTHLPPENDSRRRFVGYVGGTAMTALTAGAMGALHVVAKDTDERALKMREGADAPKSAQDYMSPNEKREFATALSDEASTQRWFSTGVGAVGAYASTLYYKLIAPRDPEPMNTSDATGKLSRREMLVRAGQLGAAAVTVKAICPYTAGN